MIVGDGEGSGDAAPAAVPEAAPSRHDDLASRLARVDARRRRARGERRASLWTQIARVGSLGWIIALPIVAGAFVGHLIDRWLDTGIAWALTLMVAGIFSAAYGLWSELRKGS